ncbi:MAG TPA: bifunctional hydroxymethylpyrimidine kinase/phosphomethylpyrimidine kinase [Candidatus Limosilactobacillus faecipullorum]|nr:bifunctional hydroxymethylpyrimidine kinase/phosphomethylpyrimidine kinase [Candidatus Limosilactobacillus faecipullorum]
MIDTRQALTIAGHDSDGSAGMPADLHAFFADGVYGHGILTAAVAGNSHGIYASQVMPANFIAKQFEVLTADFNIQAAKTGMLANDDVINVVADQYSKASFGPLVVDPVIITKHGAMLLDESAYELFRERIIPLAAVLTPNFFEAQKLTERELKDDEAIVEAAKELQQMGAQNVIIKGQHQPGQVEPVRDFVLLADGEEFWLSQKYVATDRVNGTGDTYSAIITAELAKGVAVKQAVIKANHFVHTAIQNELTVGHQYGPINHWAGMKLISENKE